MSPRHFLSLNDLSKDEFKALIHHAIKLKKINRSGEVRHRLAGRVLAMIFEKSSTRTRVSFETAMAQAGGHAIFLSPDNTQLGRGEPMEDTARVLSEMVDIVMIRTYAQSKLKTFADYSSIPVINALTDEYHPCQLLADMQTYEEVRGSIEGKTVAWLGDGNNMCHSYVNAAHILGFNLNIACPEGYEPDADVVDLDKSNIQITNDAREAAEKSDLVVTDVWASMGQEGEADSRLEVFRPYQVNAELMQLANEDAVFMHCLPAHRGDEVTAEVIDGEHSVVWQEAGNRLHAQKALLEFLLHNNFPE